MKKIMIMLATVCFAISAGAQTVDEGIKQYNYENYQKAQTILAPLAGGSALANYYLGLSYLEQGDKATASSTFAKFPEDPANISGMARVAFENKDVAKGTQIAKDLAAKSKKKEWIQEKYAADAITYTEGGDYQQAIAWYKDALTKNDDPSTHIGLGDAYRKIMGGGGEAMNNYEHVTEKDTKNSLGYSRIGDLWYEAKNFTSALENYEKAKNADPSNPLPYRSLADAFSRSGQHQKALENAKKYYELSDKTRSVKMKYAANLFLAKSACEAAQMAEELLKDETDAKKKTQLYGILGFSQADCGDSIKAIQNIRTYLSMQDPKKILPNDYLQIGKLYMKAGMLDSAGVYYNKGIEGDTAQNKTDIYRQIAEAYKSKKDYTNASKWYDNLVKANPNTQALDYFWRGYLFYVNANYTKANEAFQEFETKYPDQQSATYWHGRVNAAIDSLGETGAALPYFTKWLDQVGPNYEKKNDMKIALEYTVLVYYKKKDKDNLKIYTEKLLAVDPNNSLVKQIAEAEKANNAPKKPAPKKP